MFSKMELDPGNLNTWIRGTADVTDSRHNSLFTFLSTATEKLENQNKFQGEVSPTCNTYSGLKLNR